MSDLLSFNLYTIAQTESFVLLFFSRDRDEEDQITQEERDARTVFIMQLARNLTIRDIQDFFSKVGQVRDVRLISDRNSRRSKGIGYVEFTDPSAVTLVGGHIF